MTQHWARAASVLSSNSRRGRLLKRSWPVWLVLVAALLLAVPFLFHAGATVHAADNEITGVTLSSPEPGELVITWDAPSDAPDDYRVTWKKSGGKWPSYKNENTAQGGNAFPTGMSHTVTGLEEGTDYSVRVRARYHDGNGNVEQSGPWTATQEITVASTPLPAKPTGLSTTPSHDSVVLSWTDPGDSAITGYQVLRGQNADNLAVLTADTGSAASSYTDDSVTAETTYVYAIRARNAHGLGPQSDGVSAVTPAAPKPPAKPTGLLAATTHSTVLLYWTDPNDDSITSYQVLRGDDADSLAVLTDDTGNANTDYTDDTVEAETEYFYAIRARNANGLGPQSDPITVRTLAAPVEPEIALATATGQPQILGSIQVGATLSVDTSDIEDTDGLTNVSYSYQWIRIDTDSTETNISTDSTYTLTTDDEGKTIKVKVSFTDDASQSEEVESDATRTVAGRGNILLVGNRDRSEDTAHTMLPSWQGFTTGDDPNGYSVASIKFSVHSGRDRTRNFSATMHLKDGGNPGSEVFQFETPLEIERDTTLYAPPDARLTANTGYYFQINSDAFISLSLTSDNDEDSDSQPNWTIENGNRNSGIFWNASFRMDINGWVVSSAPSVTNIESIAIPMDEAGYDTGDIIKIRVTYSEAVDVSGTPTLDLAIGSSTVNAQYQSADSTDTQLVFAHTVTASDLDSNGFQVKEHSLDGNIKRDGTQVDTDLLHNKLITSLGERVNSGVPLTGIAIISRPISRNNYGPEEDINIKLTFAAPVTVTGDPEFEFSLGNAGEARDVRAQYNADLSTTTDVVFTYTVLPTDEDSNGIFLRDGTTSLKLDGDDSIQGDDNRDAVFNYPALSAQGSHKIDPRPRTLSVEVTSTPTAGTNTYGAGEIIEFTLTFNQPLILTGEPHYVFSLGNSGVARRVTATYDAGRSSARALVFTYRVVSTDVDNNGIYLYAGNTSFVLETGETVRNKFGNDARTDYGGDDAEPDHKVDGSLTPDQHATRRSPHHQRDRRSRPDPHREHNGDH